MKCILTFRLQRNRSQTFTERIFSPALISVKPAKCTMPGRIVRLLPHPIFV
ncbi:MAG: hypothetical protein H0T83_02410 [Chthoniobacterales bacterium]|nr:hypothetical protein [Chthoniobacterales bacterium]